MKLEFLETPGGPLAVPHFVQLLVQAGCHEAAALWFESSPRCIQKKRLRLAPEMILYHSSELLHLYQTEVKLGLELLY